MNMIGFWTLSLVHLLLVSLQIYVVVVFSALRRKSLSCKCPKLDVLKLIIHRLFLLTGVNLKIYLLRPPMT